MHLEQNRLGTAALCGLANETGAKELCIAFVFAKGCILSIPRAALSCNKVFAEKCLTKRRGMAIMKHNI